MYYFLYFSLSHLDCVSDFPSTSKQPRAPQLRSQLLHLLSLQVFSPSNVDFQRLDNLMWLSNSDTWSCIAALKSAEPLFPCSSSAPLCSRASRPWVSQPEQSRESRAWRWRGQTIFATDTWQWAGHDSVVIKSMHCNVATLSVKTFIIVNLCHSVHYEKVPMVRSLKWIFWSF